MPVNVPQQVAMHHVYFQKGAVRSEANTKKVKSTSAVLLLASNSFETEAISTFMLLFLAAATLG